jgi:uncharacterized protein (TIGR03437 family)
MMSGVSHPDFRTGAPLGLITIFGQNLFRVPADSGSFEAAAPLMLNGTTVTVGGREAAIVTLGRDASFIPTDYIVAQVPAGVSRGRPSGGGEQLERAGHGGGGLTVHQIAPVLYFDEVGAIAFRVSDMSLIGPGNPARRGTRSRC